MANVLPLDAQKRVWRQYLARYVIIVAIAIGMLACLLALALVPSYLALSRNASPAETAGKVHGSADDAKALARTNALVAALSPALSSTSSPSAIIEHARSAMPIGMMLDHITYTVAQKDVPAKLLLMGTAAREKIAAYKNTLTSDSLFKNVSVPVGALVGTDGGHFTMTLNIVSPF